MEKSVKDFLIFCLHEDALPLDSFRSIDWEKLLEFGNKQSISGVLFHGIKRLKAEDVSMPRNVFKQWMRTAMAIKEANTQTFSDNAKATSIFYYKYGHKGCTLKGQGNAMMYPDPYMRSAGDIDLWGAPNKGETIDDIIRLCRKISADCDISYHHAEVGTINDTPIELHFRPSFIENRIYNVRLQRYFIEKRNDQFHNFVTLPDNTGIICVPKDDFNLIFQLSHIQRHFFFEGIGMRHLIDYYYLLRRGFTDGQKEEYASMLQKLNMKKFACGIMYVMQDYFGLEPQYLLLKPNRRIGRFIMSEVLQTGNFGYGDNRFKKLNTDNKILGALFSIVKEFRFILEFPGETLFGHALWIMWWHFYYRRKLEQIANKK